MLSSDILCFLSYQNSLRDCQIEINFENFSQFMERFHDRKISKNRFKIILQNL